MRQPFRRVALIGAAACAAAVVASRTAASTPAVDRSAPAQARAAVPAAPAESLFVGRTRGSPGARVTVYELSDFQCPFCRRFATETWTTVDREYVTPGKVRWVFVNAPMPKLHPNAPRAAQYATCARRQGKFWQMHDLLFAQQQDWARLSPPDSVLGVLANSAGLDAARLEACLHDPVTGAELAQDAAFVARLGFQGAPSFAADGRVVVLGAQPADSFRVALDALLKAHKR